MTTRGGNCPDEPCEDTWSVSAAGRWQHTRHGGVVGSGQLSAQQTADLVATVGGSAIATGGLAPFTDVCPTAVDGVEFVYTVTTAAGLRSASSCAVRIPATDPVVLLLNEIRLM